MKKRVYLYREGAFGDHIHCSNVIRAYKEEGWEVTFCYNLKGAQIHRQNPMIDRHQLFESPPQPYNDAARAKIEARAEELKRIVQEYDRFVSFQQSLEGALIAAEGDVEYFWPLSWRRKKNAGICFYDQSMIWAGLTDQKYMGRSGDIFFTSPEHEHTKAWIRKVIGGEDKYFILWALRGSMWQKAIYPIVPKIANEFLDRHPEAVIVTTGDEFCKTFEWEHERVLHKSGHIPFRQALNLAYYADMVITPETGLGIGAGAFSTPKIMLMTAASLKNIVGNDKNDYSLQADIYCSPCHRAIYNTANCKLGRPVKDYDCYGEIFPEAYLPACVEFDPIQVLNTMETIYHSHGKINEPKRRAPLSDEWAY